MSNSSLVNFTLLSPSSNHYGARTHEIDRITPHMVVGQCTVESLGNLFYQSSRGATSNYGVGYDGRIGLYCEEKNAAGTSSSYANDNRAVTIEIASDTTYPYALKTEAYNAAINLMADICKRNGKKKLTYIDNSSSALNHVMEEGEMLITFHKWFASTACPGYYIESHITDMVTKVNAILNSGGTGSKSTTVEVAQAVIDGSWGNGQARVNALTSAGYDATDVQSQVDLMLAKKGKLTKDEITALLPTLTEGSGGDAVVLLQTWLKKAGYFAGSVDGKFGSVTLAAVKKFQTNYKKIYGNMGVDGKFGPKCWNIILE